MARRYYACAFGTSTRSYTYHFDGDEAFEPGDKVVVTNARGPAIVTVVPAVDEAPKFETKPIVGKDRPPQPVAETETVDADDLISPEDLF